ncbi:hypothetical protein Ciccas_000309 [Cichlidogyrus casuarinus]|uniref:peptidylprolyl isomerase n=1 Tax=Cichlidogyrus casuarinus TaxID=1844966 RepID=A0ABD2QND9_9PLAT
MKFYLLFLCINIYFLVLVANEESQKKSKDKLERLHVGVTKRVEDCQKRAEAGDQVAVHYTGKLLENLEVFDSSEGRRPLEFKVSSGQMIKGFDNGVIGMCVGEKRKLKIPSAQGYGSRGSPPKIPPDSDLIFEVEMMKIDPSHSEL